MNQSTFSSFSRALAGSLVLHALVFAFGAQLLARLPKPARPPQPGLSVRLTEPPRVQTDVVDSQPELRMSEDTPAEASSAVKRAVKRVAKPAVRPGKKTAPPGQKKRLALAEVRAPKASQRTGPSENSQELTGAAARIAREQIARELFYPLEAIDRGLEGEVLVMLFLDAAGNAIAARIEASSGHPILDQAAVRAARTLHSLPAGAPREALVPVRFRLR